MQQSVQQTELVHQNQYSKNNKTQLDMKIYPYVDMTRANKDGSFPVYFIISTKQGRFFVNTGITTCDKLVEMSFPKADANWKRKTILLGKYFAAVTSLCLEWDIAGLSNQELKRRILSDVFGVEKKVKASTLSDAIMAFADTKRELCMEKPVVSQFSDYDFSLILKNTRMTPKYDRGDELFFKKASYPEWGNDFLLDTSDGPKFKRIYDNGDSVRCVSYNKEEYPDFEVPKKFIYGYYRCVGVLKIL